jgi:piezo-type mechanosensitive ion channel component 1/2
LLLFFWLTLRQFLTERRKKSLRKSLNIEDQSSYTADSTSTLVKNSLQAQIINWIYSCLVKYWIYLSSGMLLLMSCQNQVVAYRIGYMILFLAFITSFQVYFFMFFTFLKIKWIKMKKLLFIRIINKQIVQLLYKLWRYSLYVFHLIVIIYSMIVLLLIYVFQFDEVPMFFKRILNINDLTLSAIGFEKFEKKDELFLKLLTPTTFLIVNILQIHYFNKEWLELTENNRE